MLLLLALLACGHPAAPASPVSPTTTPTEVTPNGPPAEPMVRPVSPRVLTPPTLPNTCGRSPSDWCAAPAGDPCGAHTDKGSCEADPRCEGMVYTGESMVACVRDARCFSSNCPTVGCESRCETLDQAGCAAQADRCTWQGSACSRTAACGAPAPTY